MTDLTEIKALLDFTHDKYNSVEFIHTDPISVPHSFQKKEDIEIAAFLVATIAWGQRITIIKNGNKLMEWMHQQPHDFILNFSERDIKPFRSFVHRTFNGADCEYFLWALKSIYQQYDSLENAFSKTFLSSEKNIRKAITDFRERFFAFSPPGRTQKHIADPERNASAKRLNMFLRWMVRNDNRGVDFGIWQSINPSQLICPLDIHSGRVARKLGLLHRTTNDWAAAEELTERLSVFDCADPVKYDFALFGLGIFEKF